MSFLKFNYSYVLLIVISLAISLQFDYLFFNIPFFVPFFVIFFTFIVTSLTSVKNSEQIILLLLFLSYVAFSVFLTGMIDMTEIRRTVTYPLYVVVAIYVMNGLLYNINSRQMNRVIKATLFFCVFAALIETYFRLYYPTLDLRSENFANVSYIVNLNYTLPEFMFNAYFYAYKFSSIMFFDSNFVGLFLLPLLVLSLFYADKTSWSLRIKLFILIILFLVVLTFSRSAIISALFILYLFLMYKLSVNKRSLFFLFVVMSLFLIVLGVIYFSDNLKMDGSFNTKLGVFASLSTLLDHDVLNVLFGYGVDAGGTVYSYKEDAYAHALIPLLLGQFGLIGLFLYLSVLAYLSYKAGFFGWLLFLVIMLSGLSLADPWQILNYFVFLIIGHARRLDTRGIKYERN